MMLLAANQQEQINQALGRVSSTMPLIVTGVLSALVFILLAMLVANMIKFDPGANPKDKQKRRLWFWILGVLATVVSFVLIFVVFKPIVSIEVFTKFKGVEDQVVKTYTTNYHNYTLWQGISTGATFVIYVVLGFVLSKIFKTKKIGNWF